MSNQLCICNQQNNGLLSSIGFSRFSWRFTPEAPHIVGLLLDEDLEPAAVSHNGGFDFFALLPGGFVEYPPGPLQLGLETDFISVLLVRSRKIGRIVLFLRRRGGTPFRFVELHLLRDLDEHLGDVILGPGRCLHERDVPLGGDGLYLIQRYLQSSNNQSFNRNFQSETRNK